MKMEKKAVQVCTNCVMGTTDSSIVFDEKGVCDFCNNYYNNILPNWHPNESAEEEMGIVLDKIKAEGKENDYDCLIGTSGGLDSSYLVYAA